MHNNIRPQHYLAPAGSIALHAALLACLLWPYTKAYLPAQQIIDVSIVMVSAPAPTIQEVAEASGQPLPIMQGESVHPLPTPAQPKPEKSASVTPPATRPQSVEATQQVAAFTRPVYDAQSMHNVPPTYPESARNRGIQGDVTLEVDVTEQGTAREVTVLHSSGYALLDHAAHDAIIRWHFIPARRGNEIVEAKVTVPVEFRLE